MVNEIPFPRRLLVFNRQQYAVNRGGQTFYPDRWSDITVHSPSQLRQVRACVYLAVSDVTNTPPEQIPTIVGGRLIQPEPTEDAGGENAPPGDGEQGADDGENKEGEGDGEQSEETTEGGEQSTDAVDPVAIRAQLAENTVVALRAMAARDEVKVAASAGKDALLDALTEAYVAAGGIPTEEGDEEPGDDAEDSDEPDTEEAGD